MDWELRLKDAMSSPAAKMAASLRAVEDSLRAVDRQVKSQAADKMADGLAKQRAQLRLQRTDLAANLRQQRETDRAAAQAQKEQSRAQAAAAREDRVKMRAAESQARLEARAKASAARAAERSAASQAKSEARQQAQVRRSQEAAARFSQRLAQDRARVNEGVRRREAAALAASARAEQRQAAAKQRENNRQVMAANRARVAAEKRAARDMEKAQASAGGGEGAGGSTVAGVVPGQVGLLLKIAAAAAAAAVAVGAIGAAFVRAAVEAVAFREAAIGGLTQVLKSATEAAKVYNAGIGLSVRWNLDPRQTVTQLQELVSKGFSASDARVLLTASADLKVMSPTANVAGIMLAIGQIRSKGVLQMEELQGQLAEAGINVGKTLEIIGRKVGKSSADVRKMISAGKIDSNTGIWAIVKSIEEMGGGKLGSVADKASQSISSMMTGLSFRPGLLGLKLAETLEGSAGQKAVQQALSQLLIATDPTKSAGMRKLISAAGGLANELLQALFGPLGSTNGWDMMQGGLLRAAAAIRLVAAGVRSVAPLVRNFLQGFGEGSKVVVDVLLAVGRALGFGGDMSSSADAARLLGKSLAILIGVAGAMVVGLAAASASITALVTTVTAMPAVVVGALSSVVAYVLSLGGQLLGAGVQAGINLSDGLRQGIESGISSIIDAGTQLALAAKTAVTSALDINSPSRVMAELGGYTAEGFATGVDDGMGQVDASMRDLVTPPVPTAQAGGTSTTLAAGGVTITVNVGGGAAAGDGKDVAAEVRAAVEQALESILGQMGAGPAPAT